MTRGGPRLSLMPDHWLRVIRDANMTLETFSLIRDKITATHVIRSLLTSYVHGTCTNNLAVFHNSAFLSYNRQHDAADYFCPTQHWSLRLVL